MQNTSDVRSRQRGSVLHLYRDVWTLLRGRRRLFAGAVVLLISAQIVLLCIPYLSGRALNALQLQGTTGLGEAAKWLSLALLVACASWLLHGPARFLERNAAIAVRQRMSSKLLEKLFGLPFSWHESQHSAAMAHRVQQSTQALSNFTQSQFIYLNSGVRLVGPLLALVWMQPIVGTAAVIGFALIVFSVAGFDRAMLRLAQAENDAERRYSAALHDSVGNICTVYALRQARGVYARLETKLVAVFVPLRKAIVLNEAKWFTVDIATRTLNCCLVGLFVWLAARAGTNGGGGRTLLLGSLYMVWEYAQQAAGVIASIASHFQTYARQHADYASADVIHDAALHSAPAPAVAVAAAPAAAAPAAAAPVAVTPAPTHWQSIAFRDLTFRHESRHGHASALHSLCFSFERRKRYALIGASGSGKSTLLRLLAGLYVAERVVVTVDDRLIHVVPVEAAQLLRAGATLIPQDAEVYEGTLAENLCLCESVQGPPAPAAYSRALQAACATDFMDSTTLGLETMIAERGANLSGGQRHRVALARGILAAAGSALVLLDEPTASLDPATEARVYSNLFAAFADACVVSSIHRLDLLGLFDEVLVMRDGQLIAQGSPDELALSCLEFRRLTSLVSRDAHDSLDARHSLDAPASSHAVRIHAVN